MSESPRADVAAQVMSRPVNMGQAAPANLPAVNPNVDITGASPSNYPPALSTRIACDTLDLREGQVATSLPCETQRERAKILAILTREHPSIGDAGNTTIEVAHYVATIRSKTDRDSGETTQLPFYVLLRADGTGLQGYGRVPLSSLRMTVASMGPPPWSPPLPLDIIPWSDGPDRRSVSLALNIDKYLAALDAAEKAERDAKKRK